MLKLNLRTVCVEWHYVIQGPKDSLYAGGYYWGVIKFPPEYPYKPPSILMFTKSGRFQVNTRLCLSMSDFHPETWNPMWSVASILSGLLSFMLDTTPTFGSIESTDDAKRSYAAVSLQENAKVALFRKLFPALAKQADDAVAARTPSNSTTTLPVSSSSPAPSPTDVGNQNLTIDSKSDEPKQNFVLGSPAVQQTDYALWFFVTGGMVGLVAILVLTWMD